MRPETQATGGAQEAAGAHTRQAASIRFGRHNRRREAVYVVDSPGYAPSVQDCYGCVEWFDYQRRSVDNGATADAAS